MMVSAILEELDGIFEVLEEETGEKCGDLGTSYTLDSRYLSPAGEVRCLAGASLEIGCAAYCPNVIFGNV
jgi:hypothetical protein